MMNKLQLEVRQDEIVSKLIGDGTFNRDPLHIPQAQIEFMGDDVALVWYYRALATHEEAAAIVAKVQAFYERITPEELKLLKTRAYACAYCGESYTLDEFPEVYNPSAATVIMAIGKQHSEMRDAHHPYCNRCVYEVNLDTHGVKERKGYVYLANIGNGTHKIGRSQNPEKRMLHLRPAYDSVELVCSIPARDMYYAEAHLHLIFSHRHIGHELFELDDRDVERIMVFAQNGSLHD